MKIKSLQFKFLIIVISAMLAITVFIGGLSIYEVDNLFRARRKILLTLLVKKTQRRLMISLEIWKNLCI